MLIQTRYLPPTDTKGARIKAWAIGRSFKPVIVGFYDSTDCPHKHAAHTFAHKRIPLQWCAGGFHRAAGSDDEKGYVYALNTPDYRPDEFRAEDKPE